MSALKNGYSPSANLNELIQRIYKASDGNFRIVHVPGEDNVADEPSRHLPIVPEKLFRTKEILDKVTEGTEMPLPTFLSDDDKQFVKLLDEVTDLAVSDDSSS